MSQLASMSEQEQQFINAVQQAIETQDFDRLILSQYKGELAQLEKMTFRIISLQDQFMMSCLYRYKTQDVTKNYAMDESFTVIQQLFAQCKQANLFSTEQEIQLKKNKKKALLTYSKTAPQVKQQEKQHDRQKHRYVDQDSYFLQPLGITDSKAQLIPSMARKWKQINKFVEIFSGALDKIDHQDQALQVVDFGSGKGYLTFALYDYLEKNKIIPHVTGVELNPKMVEFCQKVATQSAFKHLDFFQGDVRTYAPEKLDVMIALHACDVATDFAIHTG